MVLSAIQPLPNEVVNLIAAGEVIDSLAAVVRELVENSLDAGATRITIEVWADLWRIRVSDNGCGMNLSDLRCCIFAHSTSKIRTPADLWKITSLGFRGEALHSLAQLAELEILSRPALEEGWRVLYMPPGEPVIEERVAIAPGTIVTVSDLFGSIPLRRKGLPALKQQLKEVQTTIQHFALCHPHITWQVQQNDRPWFSISPSIDAQQILPQVLKRVHFHDLQQLSLTLETPFTSSPSQLEVVIGLPDRCHRRKPDWVKVATNGRIVRSQELEQTILGSFLKTLPRDRYPVCFLHLKTCPSQIDWNRHPAKTLIYLHSLSFWQEKTSEAITQALRLSDASLPANLENSYVSTLLKAAEASEGYHLDRTLPKPSQPSNELRLLSLQAVAQVRNTYIVAEHATGIWLVEQHIAHERILYEQLVAHWQLEALETPVVLSSLTEGQLAQLQRLGMEVEAFGEDLWAVRSVPALLKNRDDCADALIELSWGGDLQEAQVAVACRSAIRNGTPLSLDEMQNLLDQWKITCNPRTCPHGRPIYLALEESSLARFFKRHWVIGKSHGI